MAIIVTKFGGSSLADAEQIKKVKRIVELDPSRKYVEIGRASCRERV